MPVSGSNNTTQKLFAMQTRPVEAGGRCHFPWGRGPAWRGAHLGGPCFWSSVYIDDQLVVDRGRLVLCDDPEIQDLAAKCGDPDELLSHATHAQ